MKWAWCALWLAMLGGCDRTGGDGSEQPAVAPTTAPVSTGAQTQTSPQPQRTAAAAASQKSAAGCTRPNECVSGICEFFEPGCDVRGKCAPPRRPLRQDEVDAANDYCACDGTTMTKAWRPYKPYTHVGPCP